MGLLTTGVLLIALGLGCGPAAPPQPGRAPVLLLALDGLEWNVLLPLLREGELPHFAELIRHGQAGLLTTFQPTYSPVVWTTVATGKTPGEHGIRDFVVRRDGRIVRLFNSLDRRAKAFWNILSDYGHSVAIVGWWMTYPVEAVNGVMVAQVNTLDQAFGGQGRAVAKGRLMPGLEGQVHPPDRLERVLSIHDGIEQELAQRARGIFGTFRHAPDPLARQLLANTLWSLRADATYVEVLSDLLAEGGGRYDLVALYLGGPDVVGHRFWRYLEPDRFVQRPSREALENFGGMIPSYYRYADRVLGAVRSLLPNATVFVLSDHGMHATNTQQVFDADELPVDVNSGGHGDAPPGVLMAAGPGVRAGAGREPTALERSALPTLGSIYDIAPTLLALLGVPVGEDMRGRVLDELVAVDLGTLSTIASHDTPEWSRARAALAPDEAQHRADDVRMQQLRALGYIE